MHAAKIPSPPCCPHSQVTLTSILHNNEHVLRVLPPLSIMCCCPQPCPRSATAGACGGSPAAAVNTCTPYLACSACTSSATAAVDAHPGSSAATVSACARSASPIFGACARTAAPMFDACACSAAPMFSAWARSAAPLLGACACSAATCLAGQMVPPQVQELLASPVVLPSPYLEQAVQGFQDTLDTYRCARAGVQGVEGGLGWE